MADGWMFIPVAVSIHMIGQWLTFLNCNWSTATTSYVLKSDNQRSSLGSFDQRQRSL